MQKATVYSVKFGGITVISYYIILYNIYSINARIIDNVKFKLTELDQILKRATNVY